MSAIHINGATRLYAIVGDPIAQARSPEAYSALFADAGMNAVMVPMHVRPQHFEATMRALLALGNLDGLVATVPYKARIVPFADRLGATAGCIGALNALRRETDGTWTGEMFDGAGFVRGAAHKGQVLRGRRVALFGAHKLADAFPTCRIEVRETVPNDADMIVNASTVGMGEGDGLPGELGALDSGTLVGDVIVSPTPTPIIRQAIDHGCAYVTGMDMFAGQSDALLSFFARR